jgi:hypothetical protein
MKSSIYTLLLLLALTPAFSWAKIPDCSNFKLKPLPHGAVIGKSVNQNKRGMKKKWAKKGKIKEIQQGSGQVLLTAEMKEGRHDRTFAGFGALSKDNVTYAMIWMYSDSFLSRAGGWQSAALALAKKINAKYGRKADDSSADDNGGIKVTWNEGDDGVRLVLSASAKMTSLSFVCDATKEYLDAQARKSLDVGF